MGVFGWEFVDGSFLVPCDTTPVGSVGACDVICNDVVM